MFSPKGSGSKGRCQINFAELLSQGQPEDAVESADRAIVLVVGIGPVPAFGAVEENRGEGQRAVTVVVVNVVVGGWGASSEVFLRPLYAVKGLPSYFCHPSFFPSPSRVAT